MTETIIDTPWRTTPHLPFLREQGIRTIIRYYNHTNSGTLPEKRLTKEEAEAICDHGMTIAVVFQQNGRNLSDFSTEKGASDAQRAMECASIVGQPEGSAIYFGVDHDFYRNSEVAAVIDHFKAVKATIAGKYAIGAYASGGLATRLLDQGLIGYAWLPRALGWSGSRDFHLAGKWHLFQNAVDTRLGSLDVDTNIANSRFADFGQFSLGDGPALPADSGYRPRLHVVIARDGLNLRAGPGTGFGVLRTLPVGTIVSVVEPGGGEWAKVSLQGDQIADGYMYRAFLVDFMEGYE